MQNNFQITNYNPPILGNNFFSVERKTDQVRSFDRNEISTLLADAAFVDTMTNEESEDPREDINWFRAAVSPSLTAGLDEILLSKIQGECPIVEIGSRIGYELSSSLATKTIRIQPSSLECQLLKRSSSCDVYQLGIEGLYNRLSGSGKTIPLIFALTEFDSMPPEARQASLLQLNQLQSSGDHLMILLDTNPILETTIELLESLHPGKVAMPYFSLETLCSKLSVVLLPEELFPHRPSTACFLQMMKSESLARMKGFVSPEQALFHIWQKNFNAKVIDLENFFAEHMKEELHQAGYDAKVYYHTTFTTAKCPDDMVVTQDMIYKSVSDLIIAREWALDDSNLLSWLLGKGISLPFHFNEAFIKVLRQKGEKIFGAEFLVIEATKR